MWEDSKYTSTTDGSKQGASWQGQGLMKFNKLSKMAKQQHEVDKELPGGAENKVDLDLVKWGAKPRLEQCDTWLVAVVTQEQRGDTQ